MKVQGFHVKKTELNSKRQWHIFLGPRRMTTKPTKIQAMKWMEKNASKVSSESNGRAQLR